MRLPSLALIAASMCAAPSAIAQPAPAPAPQAPLPEVPPPPPSAQPAQPAPPAQPGVPAEPAPATAPDAPPPPPSYQQPGDAGPATADACTPPCRSGYLCQHGRCVSACNPPCDPGQRCTAETECIADPAAAQPPFFAHPGAPIAATPAEGFEQHDGFMLRATIGLGGGGVTREGSRANFIASDAEFSGAGLLWSLDIGGSPIENLVLHGRISAITIDRPKTTLDGDDLGSVDEYTIGALLLGPAVSYYFMPVNIYATAAIGLGVPFAVHEDDDRDEETAAGAGFGLNLDVGKEWWVNDDWGLGVAGRFWYASAKDSDDDADLESIGGGVLFSATYH